MKSEDRVEFIVEWIKNYCKLIEFQPASLVVGISGGIDSAVTSTLCAKTGLKTIVVSMPINQNQNQHTLSLDHMQWLKLNYTSQMIDHMGRHMERMLLPLSLHLILLRYIYELP